MMQALLIIAQELAETRKGQAHDDGNESAHDP